VVLRRSLIQRALAMIEWLKLQESIVFASSKTTVARRPLPHPPSVVLNYTNSGSFFLNFTLEMY
jgi:hypothetical protein